MHQMHPPRTKKTAARGATPEPPLKQASVGD